MWPEVEAVLKDHRYELILSGPEISKRLKDSEDGLLESKLFECHDLNFLRISDTILTSLPSQVSKLSNLTSLVLYSNNLVNVCSEVKDLKKLKLLDLSRNQLTEIPVEIEHLTNLSTLNISLNKLSTIPCLSKNTKLSILDLSCNNIEDLSEICSKLLVHLAEVYLKGNQIKNIPSSIRELISLKILDLSDNKIENVPAALSDCNKLKDINLKGNPLTDKRFSKLVDQCRTKQIVDYVREHGRRDEDDNRQSGGKDKNKSKGRNKQDSISQETELKNFSKKLYISKQENVYEMKITDFVKDVRPHLVACIVRRLSFTVETFKKFIQLQTKLHDTICDKRIAATIATHDLDSCKGRLVYTALTPNTLKITPLMKKKEFTGKELFQQLQQEAEQLRKEKKRNVYSGIHKYLYLIDGKPVYPCVLDEENRVISFPPITNSETTKLSVNSKNMLIEVTSATGQGVCRKALDQLLNELLSLGVSDDVDLELDDQTKTLYVDQVRVVDEAGNLKTVYPSRTDLVFENPSFGVVRE